MMHTGGLILVAALWALGAGALVWVVTIPLRRSFAGQLASPVLVATFASLAAILGSEHAMFYASGDFRVAVVVALAAGLTAAATAFASAHMLVRDTRTLARAVQAVGQGRRPDVSTARMSGELSRLRAEVDEAARRLNDAGERERSLENSRRELIAWVSHDLRTPLAGLRAMAEALEDGLVETPERYYKQIRVDVDTLTDMVDDLFELSRIQAGALRLGNDRVSLDDIVSDCIAALEPLARANQVRLVGSTQGDAVVTGDGRELNRAMTNLIVNAIRHTHDEGVVRIEVRSGSACSDPPPDPFTTDEVPTVPVTADPDQAAPVTAGPDTARVAATAAASDRVTASARVTADRVTADTVTASDRSARVTADTVTASDRSARVTADGVTADGLGADGLGADVVEVTVTDGCGGIPADELARVFDIGFRGEPARTPDPGVPGGAGLGLAITRGIVEAHHGTVQVANVETGDGCRFTVRVPR